MKSPAYSTFIYFGNHQCFGNNASLNQELSK